MRINKVGQYALGLVFYISENKKSNLAQVADALDLSVHVLEQVGRKLRREGVLKAFRGPGGGYEIIGEPTVRQVLNAVSIKSTLSSSERQHYHGSARRELRAISHAAGLFDGALNLVLNRKIKNVMAEMLINTGGARMSTRPGKAN